MLAPEIIRIGLFCEIDSFLVILSFSQTHIPYIKRILKWEKFRLINKLTLAKHFHFSIKNIFIHIYILLLPDSTSILHTVLKAVKSKKCYTITISNTTSLTKLYRLWVLSLLRHNMFLSSGIQVLQPTHFTAYVPFLAYLPDLAHFVFSPP